MRVAGLLIFVVMVSACGPEYKTLGSGDSEALPIETGESDIRKDLSICSALDFSGVQNKSLMTIEWLNAYALALNISGSFEGNEFWKNITNNFDGQGLSLGLLNQTLGTESLQPLLFEILDSHPQVLFSHLGEKKFNSIKSMILDWKKSTSFKVSQSSFFSDDIGSLSVLDQYANQDTKIFPTSVSSENSVQWAIENLYTDSKGLKFKSDWKLGLQSVCDSFEYKQIQFQFALKIHEKAYSYWNFFEFKDLKSYLFLFDIVVQNGGLYSKNFELYQDYVNKNPSATELQKVKKILEFRLEQVKTEFKQDVFKRKNSIIDGRGVVHGANRNYAQEYCFDINSKLNN